MEIHIRGKGRVRIDTGSDYIETVKAMADYREALILELPGPVCIGNLTTSGQVGIDCKGHPAITTKHTVIGCVSPRTEPDAPQTDLDDIWRKFFA